MKRTVLALAIVALFASSAMATAFPTLTPIGLTAGYTVVTQSASEITLSSPGEAGPFSEGKVPVIAAAGTWTGGSADYVLSTTIHFDSTNIMELGFVARVDSSTNSYWVSMNPITGVLSMVRFDSAISNTVDIASSPHINGGLSVAKDYNLVFNLKDTSLTAVFSDGATRIAAVSAIDDTLDAGRIGVIDIYGTGNGSTFAGTFLNPTVNPVLMGDANLDGKTDATDLNTVLSYYNTPTGGTWLTGDFNVDGKVDATDLNTVLSFYNQSVGGGNVVLANNSVVPEPSTICLALSAFALCVPGVIRRRVFASFLIGFRAFFVGRMKMKNVFLALAIVALFAPGAMAVVFPPSQIVAIDGSGVTPTGYYGLPSGFTSLTITGNDVVTTAPPAPSNTGTTQAYAATAMANNDYTLSARVSTTSGCQVGLLARSSLTTGNSYGLSLNFLYGGYNAATLNLFEVINGQPSGTNLIYATVPWVSLDGAYDMVFSVKGNHLFASLSDATHRQTLMAYDTSYATGDAMGLLVGASDTTGGKKINGTWTNLDVGPTCILEGDANLDFTTDATDLNTVLSYYNQPGDWSKGDFNGDGMVDATDLNTVLSYYNQSIGGVQGSVNSVVPEPSTICLALSGLAMLVACWLRKRR